LRIECSATSGTRAFCPIRTRAPSLAIRSSGTCSVRNASWTDERSPARAAICSAVCCTSLRTRPIDVLA
jgi:hypothetical protein